MAKDSRTLTFFDDEENIIFKHLGKDIFETLDNIGKAILELPENEEDLTLENLMYRVIGKLSFYPQEEFWSLEEEADMRNVFKEDEPEARGPEAVLAEEAEMNAFVKDMENSNLMDNIDATDNDYRDNYNEDDDIDPYDDNVWSDNSSVYTGIDPDYSNFIK